MRMRDRLAAALRGAATLMDFDGSLYRAQTRRYVRRGPEADAAAIAGYFDAVGGYLRRSIERVEREDTDDPA